MAFDIMQEIYDTSPIARWLNNKHAFARNPILVTPVATNVDEIWCTYKGQKFPIVELRPVALDNTGTGSVEKINIWYLPYQADTAQYTILDPRKAKIMVTALMSGCTFGAGTSTINGQTIVTHTNKYSEDNRTVRRKMQAKMAKDQIREEGAHLHSGRLKPKLWEPKNYRTTDETQILLFGIYGDGKSGWFGSGGGEKWRFYQHVIRGQLGMDADVQKVAQRIFNIR